MMSDQAFFDIVVIFSIVIILLIIAVGLLGVFRTPPKRLPPRRKRYTGVHSGSSDTIGVDILEMLGVPTDSVMKATIVMEAGRPVLVTVKLHADKLDDNGDLVTMMKDYKLVAADGGELCGNQPDFTVTPPDVAKPPKPVGPANEKVRDPFTALFYRVFGNGHPH